MATCSLDTLQEEACANNFANLTYRQLLIVIAQLLCTGMTCDLDQIQADACTNGFVNLPEEKLLVVIAQLLCDGGGGGGGGTIQVFSGVADPPVAPPTDPSKDAIYYVRPHGTIYTWDISGAAWG